MEIGGEMFLGIGIFRRLLTWPTPGSMVDQFFYNPELLGVRIASRAQP